MKKEFIDSLVGLDTTEAVEKVDETDYKSWVLPRGSFIASVTYPKTIILWEANGKVTYAGIGDATELE